VEAFCTVCGAQRTPFAASILNVTGKPARIGGYTARIFGWGVLFVGLFLALTIGLVVQALASMFVAGTWLGLAIGIPIALLSIAVALLGIVGGKRLGRAGERRLLGAQIETIHSLARHQRGVVTVSDAARALGLDDARADAILVALAKDPSENVSIDVDNDGSIRYLFGSAEAIRWRIRAEETNITPLDRETLERELEQIEENGLEAEEAHARARRSKSEFGSTPRR
jgi:hypothetical protein